MLFLPNTQASSILQPFFFPREVLLKKRGVFNSLFSRCATESERSFIPKKLILRKNLKVNFQFLPLNQNKQRLYLIALVEIF